jgi:hypothetical protein
VSDRGEDPVALVGDRARELDERRQPATARPRQPPVQQPLSDRGGEPVDLSQLLLEQVRAIQPGVRLLDARELRLLAVGEVLRVLPDREPGAFELAGEREVPLSSRLVPHLAANLVERLGGEHHDMKRVHAPDRVRAPLRDRPGDPGGHVRGDQLDLFATLVTELVEEREHRLAVPARGGPHQPAAVMVHDDGQVALTLAVADLVDPDPPEPVEQIDLALRLGRDPLEDRADRPPRDAHQRRDRSLRRVHRQPRDLVLEGPGEPGVMTGPRHRDDDHAMAPARDPRCVGLNERERRSEIKCPPAPASLTKVVSRTAAAADPAAIPLPPDRPSAHDHFSLAARPDVLHRQLGAARAAAPIP